MFWTHKKIESASSIKQTHICKFYKFSPTFEWSNDGYKSQVLTAISGNYIYLVKS